MSNLTSHGSESSPKPEASQVNVRILCLGTELLADDSLGSIVAERVRQFAPPDVEVISTPEAGFHLLDYVLNVRRLLVIDSVMTGTTPPGTIYAFHEHELNAAPRRSPHYVGLHETLALARALGLAVAEEVVCLAVEAADCSTFGAEMSPAVRAAIPALINTVRDMVSTSSDGSGMNRRVAA